MPTVRKLLTQQDFQEALERQLRIRVFEGQHLVDNGTVIIRLDGDTVITQKSVSDITYHSRRDCQFFEVRK